MQENCNDKNYTYKKGYKALSQNMWETKFYLYAYLGPNIITDIRNIHTVRARKGKVTDTFSICNKTLYKE